MLAAVSPASPLPMTIAVVRVADALEKIFGHGAKIGFGDRGLVASFVGRTSARRHLPQQVPVGHRDAADDGADDADKALIGAADEQVFQVRGAVPLLFRRAVHGAVFVAGEAADRAWA